MRHVLSALDEAQPATASLVARTWANSATCALIGMVSNIVLREQAAVRRGELDANGNMDAYNSMRDEAQDDNNTNAPSGTAPKLTLDQLVEFTAAVRAYAYTIASGFEGSERRFAEPQEVKSSLEFMATPRTGATQDQIDAVLEEEPLATREAAIKIIRQIAIDDAIKLASNKDVIYARVNELLDDAPADREFDTIVDELPDNYRNGLLDKACAAVVKELDRTLPLAIKGVPGVSAKRKILRADLPALEAMAA